MPKRWPRERRGSILGPLGHHFGYHFGTICCMFCHTFFEHQGRSRGGPGARGVPLGAPGLDFGSPRASFSVPFWSNFGHVFLYFFGAISASFFYAILELFGCHFGVILDTFWRRNCSMKSVTFQRTSPGAPGHPHLDFHRREVQNRGSTFSRRGASGSDFGGQN